MTLTTRIKWLISLTLFAIASQGVHAQDSIDEGERRAQQAGASLIGKPAPAAVLETIDGERIDLSQLYGKKPVYLKFWATWCGPCITAIPHLTELQKKHPEVRFELMRPAGENERLTALLAELALEDRA